MVIRTGFFFFKELAFELKLMNRCKNLLPKWQFESKTQIPRPHPSSKGMTILGAGPRNLHFSSKSCPGSLQLETCCPGAFTLREDHT